MNTKMVSTAHEAVHDGKGKCKRCGKSVVRCEANGARCSIDGYYFADGDDICSGIGHHLGHYYHVGDNTPRR